MIRVSWVLEISIIDGSCRFALRPDLSQIGQMQKVHLRILNYFKYFLKDYNKRIIIEKAKTGIMNWVETFNDKRYLEAEHDQIPLGYYNPNWLVEVSIKSKERKKTC